MSTTRIERLRAVFDLDAESGVLRWRVPTGNRIRVGGVAGHLDNKGYVQVQVDGKKLWAHRVVFAMVNGFWPEQVDHANGIGTDNRPENLRAATCAENSRNYRKPVTNTSGVKGVHWDRNRGRWRAYCRAGGRKHNLGSFVDLDAAASAVRAFREQHHGDFARHD